MRADVRPERKGRRSAPAGGTLAIVTVPANWYPDPAGSPNVRWWDGTSWTEHLRPAPEPVAAPAQSAAPAQHQQTQHQQTPGQQYGQQQYGQQNPAQQNPAQQN
ncbi:DUF2510 domain-containing protein, partial [Nakamurella silvestris]